MGNRELAKNLIDQVPEEKLLYVASYLQGVVLRDEIPNPETAEAMNEVDHMIATGSGEHFSGSTADFFRLLAEE